MFGLQLNMLWCIPNRLAKFFCLKGNFATDTHRCSIAVFRLNFVVNVIIDAWKVQLVFWAILCALDGSSVFSI